MDSSWAAGSSQGLVWRSESSSRGRARSPRHAGAGAALIDPWQLAPWRCLGRPRRQRLSKFCVAFDSPRRMFDAPPAAQSRGETWVTHRPPKADATATQRGCRTAQPSRRRSAIQFRRQDPGRACARSGCRAALGRDAVAGDADLDYPGHPGSPRSEPHHCPMPRLGRPSAESRSAVRPDCRCSLRDKAGSTGFSRNGVARSSLEQTASSGC